jgi:hypothetical protein
MLHSYLLDIDPAQYLFPAYFVGIMFGAASNAKTLGVSIVAAIALLAVYPSADFGGFIMLFYIPFVLYASFRS